MRTKPEILEALGAERYKLNQKQKALETNESNRYKLKRQIEGHSEVIRMLEMELEEYGEKLEEIQYDTH